MSMARPPEETSLEEFITRPDTVDFVGRKTSFFSEFISSRPYIRVGNTLTGQLAVLYTSRDRVDDIRREFGTGFINLIPSIAGLLDIDGLNASGITQVMQQPFLDLRGQGTLIGIVDTGVDYTLNAFKYEDGTSKIAGLWDQTITGTPPPGYYFGAGYTNDDINEALRSENPLEIIPSRDTVGHGTFLASIAASRERGAYMGAAPDAELVAVKLRPARSYYRERYLIPQNQENAFETSDLMLGIEYILDTAARLNRPVAICIALGTNNGGHDGFSLLEEYLSIISNKIGVAVCMAAGNESQSKHHTQGNIGSPGESQEITIRTGNNPSDIYMSLWNTASDRMSVGIKSPTGEIIARVPARTAVSVEVNLILERSTVIIEYYFPVEGSGAQLTVIKILKPTPGLWTITIHGDIILNGTYHAWLPITGFVSPDVEFLTPVPNYTVVVPGTSIGAITAGAYNSRTGSLYPYSSWGPTRLPNISPDLAAPGVNVGGIYPAGYGTMSGTSVSAAITAGACALMLQWGIVQRNDVSLNTYGIRAYLIRGCVRDKNRDYPNMQWGYGKLNLFRAFTLLRA